MRTRLAVMGLLVLIGCRPLGFPMLARLSPSDQRQVDSAWDAMLTPIDRLDRTTLLDCVTFMQLYQSGVDRFSARAEKQTAAGRVEMTIDFDRARPQADQFSIRVKGRWGLTRRYESWLA